MLLGPADRDAASSTEQQSEWSPAFVEGLTGHAADPTAVDDMLRAIESRRSSKKAPKL